MNSPDTDFFILYADTSHIDPDIPDLPVYFPFPLHAFARGIASSPLWSTMAASSLVVRQYPPLIAVLGRFDPAEEARLSALAHQVTHGLRTLRYISYSRATEDCRILADRLQERFGKEELAQYSFMALPRGGLIVLGILSYLLDLAPHQLQPPPGPDTPLVVVDDCAISGLRFGKLLSKRDTRHIIFAPLYSHPDVRSAIETGESRVIACMSAHDLSDSFTDGDCRKQAFQELWRKRFGGSKRYWIGLPEYICFPWNEPDRPFWNPVLQRVESGWRILPPELCIKNRLPGIPVEIQPKSHGPLRPAGQVIFVLRGNFVIIGDIRSQESYILEGLAAEIWNAVIEYGNTDRVTRSLLMKYDTGEESLRKDVSDFVDTMKAQGLLEHTDENG